MTPLKFCAPSLDDTLDAVESFSPIEKYLVPGSRSADIASWSFRFWRHLFRTVLAHLDVQPSSDPVASTGVARISRLYQLFTLFSSAVSEPVFDGQFVEFDVCSALRPVIVQDLGKYIVPKLSSRSFLVRVPVQVFLSQLYLTFNPFLYVEEKDKRCHAPSYSED